METLPTIAEVGTQYISCKICTVNYVLIQEITNRRCECTFILNPPPPKKKQKKHVFKCHVKEGLFVPRLLLTTLLCILQDLVTKETHGVFTLPDTETDQIGCTELYASVHTVHTQTH